MDQYLRNTELRNEFEQRLKFARICTGGILGSKKGTEYTLFFYTPQIRALLAFELK